MSNKRILFIIETAMCLLTVKEQLELAIGTLENIALYTDDTEPMEWKQSTIAIQAIQALIENGDFKYSPYPMKDGEWLERQIPKENE